MDLEKVRAELEDDLLWRLEELAVLRNQATAEGRERHKSVFLKSLVLMLYAHYEGFCKHAFTVYVRAINAEHLPRSKVSLPIATSSMSQTLDGYFKRNQSFSAQLGFVTAFDRIWAEVAVLPVDEVVDTESNLKPEVMRKILCRLGFNEDLFGDHDGSVQSLMNRRNGVAHGNRTRSISEQDYRDLEARVLSILDGLITAITEAVATGHHLRPA
ncbi:MAG TPA: MAE_28990/MAE_18760 family HEPN-like nuclease [Symbiobacteriaceae bacterium]|nr:MAE_28990/MAE_18760 family HEPN-like nuclease [Symbiobacteriaceae bacterium]